MTVTTTKLIAGKTKSAISSDGRVIRTHSENWEFALDEHVDRFEAANQFASFMGLTVYGLCSYDQNAALRSMECERKPKTRDPWWYKATVEYSTDIPIKKEEDPLNDPVEIDSDTREEKRPVLWYYDAGQDRNIPIRNLAKDWFDPPLDIPVSNVVLRFVRNEPTFVPGLQYAMVDHVNATAIFGAEPGYLKCTKLHQTRKQRNQRVYWQSTYEFEHSRFGWQPRPLDQGRRMIVAGIKRDILDAKSKAPVTDPVPLYLVTQDDVDSQPQPPTEDDPWPTTGGTPWNFRGQGLVGVQADDVIPIPPEFVQEYARFAEPNPIPSAEFNDLSLPFAQV